ncbi:TetR/AcrR family transcriptional regulator [Nocardiopsis aegyptia]|uniref:TetR/AcrR family transcriptional regulator n=1 Tax=Nocardiopsis aegyptia TaxID=220378 RepID=UPI0036731A02
MTDRKRPSAAESVAPEAPGTPGTPGAREASDLPSKPTRRRGQALVDAIHDAVLREAAENGVARLTMEGVARRAGTAKTSLYRRWSTPEDILMEALHSAYPQEVPSPAADDLRGDLVAALMLFHGLMGQEPLGPVMLSCVAEASYRPEFNERLWREVYGPRGGRFTATVLRHYADRGRIDPARVTPVTVDIGEAMMVKYTLDQLEPPSPDYVERIVDEVLLSALGRDPR